MIKIPGESMQSEQSDSQEDSDESQESESAPEQSEQGEESDEESDSDATNSQTDSETTEESDSDDSDEQSDSEESEVADGNETSDDPVSITDQNFRANENRLLEESDDRTGGVATIKVPNLNQKRSIIPISKTWEKLLLFASMVLGKKQLILQSRRSSSIIWSMTFKTKTSLLSINW